MLRRRILAAVLLPVSMLPPAWGWGETGHRVTAFIAARRLSPQARLNVARILGVDQHPAAVARALADASFWPDRFARDKYKQANPWHYINLTLLHGANDQPDPFLAPDTVYAKIKQYAESIRERRPDELESGSDLKFLVHFIGDLHQPLHAAYNQDRGGNCLDVEIYRNLHSAWDTGLLEEHLGRDSEAIAILLLRKHGDALAGDRHALRREPIADLVRGWIVESNELAIARVYAPLDPPVPKLEAKQMQSCADEGEAIRGKTWTLSREYVDGASEVIEKRLTQAGIRLAAVLNRL